MSADTLKVIDDQLNSLLPAFQRYYERSICRDLTCHECQGLFERNLLKTMDKLFSDALTLVEQQRNAMTTLNPSQVEVLTQQIAVLVEQGKEQLLNHALNYNRSSCAISNFPEEHHPSAQYFGAVLAQIEQQRTTWQQHLNSCVLTA